MLNGDLPVKVVCLLPLFALFVLLDFQNDQIIKTISILKSKAYEQNWINTNYQYKYKHKLAKASVLSL